MSGERRAAGGRTERPRRVAVVGPGQEMDEENALAYEVGAELARRGAVVICGGLGGVMAAAARGCREAGGRAVGVLPGTSAAGANPWIDLPLPTGMGEGRNVLVVRFAEGIIAVGGGWGTLSEIALTRKMGRPVVTLGRPPAGGLGLPAAHDAAEAVDLVLSSIGRAEG